MKPIKSRGRRGKRGSLQDLVFLMVILLTVGITIIVATLIATSIDEGGVFDDRPGGPSYEEARIIYNVTLNRVIPTFDTIFVGVFVGGLAIIILLSFAVRSLTAFFVLGFIFTVILVMLAAILSNVYDEVADHPQLINASQDFTAMEFIMSNLPLVILGSAALVSIVIYGLFRVTQ